MNENIVKINIDDIEKKHKNENPKYEYFEKRVTRRFEFNQCYVGAYEVTPLKSAYPYHYHTKNTEVFYILSGVGEIRTPDEILTIKAGDFVVFPPNKKGAHKITNTSNDSNLSYIDFDTTNFPDIVHYPDSDKFGIVVHNESFDVYEKEDRVDYYEDE